jgi:hypothetical protein
MLLKLFHNIQREPHFQTYEAGVALIAKLGEEPTKKGKL